MNDNVNYGFGVFMMCLRRFIICNKCTTLVSDVYNEGGCVMCRGRGWSGNLWYFPLNFTVTLKLLSVVVQ